MKLIFMGTPDFALPALEALHRAGHSILGVFTQPDKPKGRGYTLVPPPVKEYALKEELPVYQPATLRDGQAFDTLKSLAPDVIVVAAYGKILPKEILALPRYGCVNIHASLLPKYRGASPVQWAVLSGETITGVTTMQMAEGLDTGDILLQRETPVAADETAVDLFPRLAGIGAELILETLEKLEAGAVTPTPQDEALASYAPIIKKPMAKVDWVKPAREINNLVRGMQPWPVAYTLAGGKMLKIYRGRVLDRCGGPPGRVVEADRRLVVSCGDGIGLELLDVQLEGGKRMPADAMLRGRKIVADSILGDVNHVL